MKDLVRLIERAAGALDGVTTAMIVLGLCVVAMALTGYITT